MGAMPRKLRRGLAGGGIAIVFLAVLIAAGYGFLQTEPGRASAGSLIERILSTKGRFDVKITKLTGSLPQGLRAAAVTVSDRDGVWLEIEDLAIDWRPLRLVVGRTEIERLAAGKVRVLRQPRQDAVADAEADAIPAVPSKVRLDRLEVKQLRLEPSVVGEPMTLQAFASLATRDETEVRTSLRLERIDGAKGHLRARIAYLRAEGLLTVDASVKEPRGGLIARLLDLPGLPATRLALRGKGPVTNWRGRLEGAADGLASADAVVTISGQEPFVLNAIGRADVRGAIGPRFRPLAAPAVAFDVAANWWPGRYRLSLTRARLTSDAVGLDAKGELNTDTFTVKADAKLEVSKPAHLNELIAPMNVARVSAVVDIEGALARPTMRASIRIGGLRVLKGTVGAADLTLAATPHRKAAKALWTIDAAASLSAVAFEDPLFSALVGEKVSAQLAGDFDLRKGTVQNARFDATAANVSARARGHGDMLAVEGNAQVAVAVRDLSPLSKLASRPVAGSLDLDADVTVDPSGATAFIKGRPKGLMIDDAIAAALLGSRPEIAATLHTRRDGGISISNATLKGAAVKLDVSKLNYDGRRLDTAYKAVVPNLTPVSKAFKAPATGSVTTSGMATGPLDDLKIKGSLDTSDLRWRTRMVGSAKATYDMALSGPTLAGAVSIAATTPAGKLDLSTRIAMATPEKLRLTRLSVTGQGTKIEGELGIPIEGGALDGRLKGHFADVAIWSPLIDLPLGGALEADLRLGSDGGRQSATLKINGRNVSSGDGIKIAALNGDLSVRGKGQAIRGRWRITAQDVESAAGALRQATISGQGGPTDAVVKFSAKGESYGPLDLSGEARVEAQGDDLRLTLRRLSGTVAGLPISLRNPAVYTFASNSMDVSVPDLSWGGGTATFAAHVDEMAVSGNATVRRLPAAAIAGFVPGLAASGHLDLGWSLAGTPSEPVSDVRVTISEVKVKSDGTADLPALGGKITGKLERGRLRVAADIDGLGKAGLTGKADVPLRLSVMPFSLSMPESQAIDARAEWRGDVGAIAPLFPLADHRLAGALALSARATGSLERPRVSGRAVWSDGTYENIATGTILRDIDLRADADGDRIELTRATANDGGDGRLAATGSIRIDEAMKASIDADVEMTRLAVVRRDDITAVASGKLRAKGRSDRMTVSGRIETNQVEATIVDSLPPEVVDIKVVEVNAPGARAATPSRAKSSGGGTKIALALDVKMPRRVFLRGRGLDSEWAGELRVTGSADAPVIKGVLRPVRGRFDLAGKVFNLGDGRVTFDGREKIDPILDVRAEHKTKDITATVRITGSASKPKIALSSVPTLPQDEILARVLFNKSVGRLTAAEAAQLGAALASLTGLDGGGLGILDRVRQALGVDALRVGKNDDGQATVGVGKYVTDDVYVGVDQGTSQKSSNVTVEVTVIPNVTVKSDVGADARSRVGVNWKLDY